MKLVKPFVKWAGGKGSLISQLKNFYPFEIDNIKIDKYVEPFVGGGAVLINILQKYDIKEVYAFDINMDLINCYNVIKSNVEELIEELEKKENSFLVLENKEREEYFYKIREEYNSYNLSENDINVKRASEFIFLNRTCFNGLYRVNKNGKFNVPCGKYKNPTICDSNNLRNLSYLIRNVNFKYGDYKKSEKYIDSNTFVYFDPPYRPLSNTSGFTSYTKEDFNDENQKELAKYYKLLDEKDAKLMLSNSNPKNTNKDDNFFEEIYKGFYINEISAKRMINANTKGRGEISELLITNYREMEECIQENSILMNVVSV
jgi:DNA adenine methylase